MRMEDGSHVNFTKQVCSLRKAWFDDSEVPKVLVAMGDLVRAKTKCCCVGLWRTKVEVLSGFQNGSSWSPLLLYFLSQPTGLWQIWEMKGVVQTIGLRQSYQGLVQDCPSLAFDSPIVVVSELLSCSVLRLELWHSASTIS